MTVIFKVETWEVWVLCYGTLDLRSTFCLQERKSRIPIPLPLVPEVWIRVAPISNGYGGRISSPSSIQKRSSSLFLTQSLLTSSTTTRLVKVLARHLFCWWIYGEGIVLSYDIWLNTEHTLSWKSVLPWGGRDMVQGCFRFHKDISVWPHPYCHTHTPFKMKVSHLKERKGKAIRKWTFIFYFLFFCLYNDQVTNRI